MKIRRLCLLLTVGAFSTALFAGVQTSYNAQMKQPMMATLLARRIVGDHDNYADAAYSFKYGINGQAGLGYTHNRYDLLFGNAPDRDIFDVTMIVSDCSRIKDLGEHNWSDNVKLPELSAFDKPAREDSIPAVQGHMYLVHTKQWEQEWDREKTTYVKMFTDYYTLFRVESLESLVSVTISWRLNSEIKKTPVDDKDGVSDSKKSNP